jgi:hypothetical protein
MNGTSKYEVNSSTMSRCRPVEPTWLISSSDSFLRKAPVIKHYDRDSGALVVHGKSSRRRLANVTNGGNLALED